MPDIGPSRWRFPPPEVWPDDDDLICIGGDLDPATLIHAYRSGLFPMHDNDSDDLGWWSPLQRGVLPLDGLRVSRSLRRSLRRYDVTIDGDFEQVMRHCGRPNRPGGWIDAKFIAAYCRLHEMGWAHSVEVRDTSGTLVGGLYGVRVAGLFAGESMFSDAVDASKVALVRLVEWMTVEKMVLLDTQWQTPHLATLGVIEIPRSVYLALLRVAVGDDNDTDDGILDR